MIVHQDFYDLNLNLIKIEDAIGRASCIHNQSKNNFQEMILVLKFVEVCSDGGRIFLEIVVGSF